MRARRTPTPVTGRVRVVAYLRVSTDKQADLGVSLEAQRAKLEQYADLYDLDVVAWEVDAGYSASTLERPALEQALSRLKRREAEGLLVYKLDRLTRSLTDLAGLIADYFSRRWSLLSVTEQVDTRTANGRMMLNMIAMFAQWEREVIGERTSVAMQHMRDQGQYTGGEVRYGYAMGDGGQLLEVVEEQATITHARTLRARGLSLRAVAHTLAEGGRLTRSGGTFTPTQVARMCEC